MKMERAMPARADLFRAWLQGLWIGVYGFGVVDWAWFWGGGGASRSVHLDVVGVVRSRIENSTK